MAAKRLSDELYTRGSNFSEVWLYVFYAFHAMLYDL